MPSQRLSDVLYERYQDLLQPLMEFYADRGRLPDERELAVASELREKLGSIRRAFGVVRRVTGDDQWEAIERERAQDLIIYLALARFDGRPRFGDLPMALRLDVKALFGAYTRACEQADELLFSAGDLTQVSKACESSTVGKATADALYVHTSALEALPPLLRIYEGCAAGWVGRVEACDIVKLSRRKAQVSYLSYPEFDTDPHPALRESLVVSLHGLEVSHRSYTDTPNPPLLHRKELFVLPDYPLREKFARLTKQEERWGLLDDGHRIGTLQQWQERLRSKGVKLKGHRVVRRQ
jgi:DNA phosphorothioation-associated putative methyltransferase